MTSTERRQHRKFLRRGATLIASGLTISAAVVMTPPVAADPSTSRSTSTTPDVAALAGPTLATQELAWGKCDFRDRDYNEAWATDPTVKCATVKVPRDWHDAGNGKTWDIEVSHTTNIDPEDADYDGTIFVNPGGPGGPGLHWGPGLRHKAPELRATHNFVGFNPRGVRRSSTAECEVTYDQNGSQAAYNKAIADACSTNPDVKTITTEQTTYDMDFIRHLLGLDEIDYVGYSYGTWLGSWYQRVFGKHADEFLLDSSTDLTQPTLETAWNYQTIGIERLFAKVVPNYVARHDARYGLGEDPAAIRNDLLQNVQRIKDDPDLRVDAVMSIQYVTQAQEITAGPANTRGAAEMFYLMETDPAGTSDLFGLLVDSTEDPDLIEPFRAGLRAFEKRHGEAAKVTVKTFKSLDDILHGESSEDVPAALQARDGMLPGTLSGDLQRLDNLLAAKSGAEAGPTRLAEPKIVTERYTDPFEMIRCGDGQWTQDLGYWDKHNASVARQTPIVTSLLGTVDAPPTCAWWKSSNSMPDPSAAHPHSVVVQPELDWRTTWEVGQTAGLNMPNTSFVAVNNESSHGLFPYGQECMDGPIFDYFLTGTKPKNVTVCQAPPLPEEDVAYEYWAPIKKNGKHGPHEVTNPFQVASSKPGKDKRKSTTGKSAVVSKKLRDELRSGRQVPGSQEFRGADRSVLR